MDLPKFFDEDGDELPMALFHSIEVLETGSTRLIYGGQKPQRVTRIITAGGVELPVIEGAELAPGCVVEIPYRSFAKLQATGQVIRNGQVVYDKPT